MPHYDVIVIGTGPAGEGAAINATKHGKTVAVIEKQELIGGGCTHQGTIPSKALRHIVRQVMRYKRNPLLQEIGKQTIPDFPAILEGAKTVIRRQVAMRSKFYERNRIDIIPGVARFSNPHSIEVEQDGQKTLYTATNIIIATGSSPYRPDNIDFGHPRVYDSDTILGMDNTPRKLIIYGAGVIGCEYASIFAGMGIKVELINTRNQLLEFLDDEISDALSYHMSNMGVTIRHREEFKAVTATDKGVALTLESGKSVKADALLWCNGRSGNTNDLNLEKANLNADGRGQIKVDQHYQTATPGIYAAGDVIGWPALASAAYDQGRSAAASARGKEQCRFVDDVPTGIYTLPEISSIGKTERELTEAKIPYEVGRAQFKDTARAQISGETVGMLKILFHTKTLEILGIHCFGAEASEIVHIGQAIMKQPGAGNTLSYFVTTTFNYPTMAEAYRVAALNGMNRL
jgi:NAD(P) transhydrogenase